MTRIFLLIFLSLFLTQRSYSNTPENTTEGTNENKWTLQKKSESGLFILVLSCKKDAKISEFLPCSVELSNNKQETLKDNISILLGGGMPIHSHGLPTDPVIKWSQNDNKFIIHGLKFSMPGEWLLHFYINDKNAEVKDVATFKLKF